MEPHHRYYHAMQGRWTGELRLFITDPAAHRAAPLTAMNRLRLFLMAHVPKLIGPWTMNTTVEPGETSVRHTTHIHKWGMTCFRSEEVISLNADGRGFTMAGEQRLWPNLWMKQPLTAEGEVAESADGAVYRIPWMGAAMVQTTGPAPEGLALRQETAWSRAAVVLRRVG